MKGPLIGTFRNEWRGRTVRIFEDTESPDMVYTEGHRIESPDDTSVIETHEPRAFFTVYIGSFHKVYR